LKLKFQLKLEKKYAAASGDYNPYHISSILAKIFGFETALVQGYWSFSKTLAYLESENKIPPYPLRLECSFKKNQFSCHLQLHCASNKGMILILLNLIFTLQKKVMFTLLEM